MTNQITKIQGLASEWVQSVKSTVGGGLETATEFIRKHPVTSAVTVGGGALIVTQAVRAIRKKSKAKRKIKKSTAKKTTRKKRSKRSWQLDRARISKQKHEVAYQKRKKKLSKKKTKKRVGVIYYTKKGQPYKVNSKGQAKFIKKRKGRRK